MVKITLAERDGVRTLHCRGHAEGRSDVCAALSTLIQTLYSWLCGREVRFLKAHMAGGACMLTYLDAADDPVYDFVRLALRRIEATVPTLVTVSETLPSGAGALELDQFGDGEADAGDGGTSASPWGDCASPLPAAEEGDTQFPQPRHWRAEAAARPGNGKCGKAVAVERSETDEGPSGSSATPHPPLRGTLPPGGGTTGDGFACAVGPHPQMRPQVTVSAGRDGRPDEGIRPYEAEENKEKCTASAPAGHLPLEGKAAGDAVIPTPADAAAAGLLAGWTAEAEALSERLPGFDLGEAAGDPRFRALLRGGFGVEEAFCAAHLDDLARAVARLSAAEAERRLLADIRARGARPDENGAQSGSAFVAREDVSRLSRRGRADIARRVARGETVTF